MDQANVIKINTEDMFYVDNTESLMDLDCQLNDLGVETRVEYWNDGGSVYIKSVPYDSERMIMSNIDENKFVHPDAPFMLVYGDKDGNVNVSWFKKEDDLLAVSKEVQSYGCNIINSIEIQGCRDVAIDG